MKVKNYCVSLVLAICLLIPEKAMGVQAGAAPDTLTPASPSPQEKHPSRQQKTRCHARR